MNVINSSGGDLPSKASECRPGGHNLTNLQKDRSIFRTVEGSLRVSGDKVFYTLQGEGPSMGAPASFLRLHNCNLKCSWCDAWYTWNTDSAEFWTESVLWTIEETRKNIASSWGCGNSDIPRKLVITGGEPLIQQQGIEQLVTDMKDWSIEIETNGTILPSEYLIDRCQFNCSPKLSNSGNQIQRRIRADVLIALNQANTNFKFVVRDEDDVEEVDADFIRSFSLDPQKIILMPEGVTMEEVAENAKKIVELVKKKGYRLLNRLQCDIWGARRAV